MAEEEDEQTGDAADDRTVNDQPSLREIQQLADRGDDRAR